MDCIDKSGGEEDVIQRPDSPGDVLDYTDVNYEYNEEDMERNKIRISNGISTRDLISEGIVFDPQIPEAEELEMNNTNYFASHSEELERLLAEQRSYVPEDEQEAEEDLTEFEHIRRVMEDATPAGEARGSVMKRVLTAGVKTGGTVPSGATVTLHYSMALEGQDEPFDSTVLRGRSERYKLDQGQLILGMETGVKTMHRNEKAQFLIDWTYAYGQHGCPPRVPGCAVILATVELLEFIEEGQAESLLGLEVAERNKRNSYEKIEEAVRLEHQNGNIYVKKEEWKMALKHYNRGVKLLQEVSLSSQEQEDRQQRLLLKLLLNTAHCCIKLKWPKKACIACREALEVEDRHSSSEQYTRALYRFGKAKRMLEDYTMAKDLLLKAQRRSPQDPHISKELLSLEDQLAREKKNEVELCQGMFRASKPSKQEEKREKEVNEKAEYFREDMELFREQPEQEMLMPATFSSMEMKALRLVATELNMEVSVEEDHRGGRKIRVSKRTLGDC